MSGTGGLRRDDAPALGLLVGIALGLPLAIAALSAARAGIAPSALGVYHDGHLYLEIARSFPLPYAAEGPSYAGQAPGYPALIALVHALTPDAWVDWGMAALLASWLPAALCAPAFYALCRADGLAPFWPTLLFVVANPRWVSVAATPHTEPLAMLFAVLCLVAWSRGRLGACAAWLSLAALTRFPALLLGAPLAFGVLVLRRRRGLPAWLWLALPAAAFALHNLYLALRLPGFSGIWSAHQVFWQASFTWPFATLLDPVGSWQFLTGTPAFWVTYASLLFYLAAIALGARGAQGDRRMLALWVAVLVLFHASLGGYIGAWDFTRLVILAWPAALLPVWRGLAPRLPRPALAGLSLAALAASVAFALGQTSTAIDYQSKTQDYLRQAIERLDDDEPRWVDFEARGRAAVSARSRLAALSAERLFWLCAGAALVLHAALAFSRPGLAGGGDLVPHLRIIQLTRQQPGLHNTYAPAYHLLGALLEPWLGFALYTKLFALAAAGLLIAGFRCFQRAAGLPGESAALFVLTPYLLSLSWCTPKVEAAGYGLLLFGLGSLLRGRLVAVALLLAAAFWVHTASALLYGLSGGVLALARRDPRGLLALAVGAGLAAPLVAAQMAGGCTLPQALLFDRGGYARSLGERLIPRNWPWLVPLANPVALAAAVPGARRLLAAHRPLAILCAVWALLYLNNLWLAPFGARTLVTLLRGLSLLAIPIAIAAGVFAAARPRWRPWVVGLSLLWAILACVRVVPEACFVRPIALAEIGGVRVERCAFLWQRARPAPGMRRE